MNTILKCQGKGCYNPSSGVWTVGKAEYVVCLCAECGFNASHSKLLASLSSDTPAPRSVEITQDDIDRMRREHAQRELVSMGIDFTLEEGGMTGE